jgi:tight adherence protein B
LSPATALAALSAACGVVAAWEVLTVAEHARAAASLRRILVPLLGSRVGATTAPERARLIALVAATLFAAGWLLDGPMLGLLCAAGGPWLPSRVVAARRRRWSTQMARGAPAAARSIADALAGGHSIRGALAEAARAGGAGGAADAELRACADALALGSSTDAALEALRTRASCAAWDTLVAAVLLNRDAGGDLATLMRELAGDLEAARRVEADARAATAQARFTGWLVAALPAAGAVLTELAAPGTLARIAGQPVALMMAIAAIVLQGLGIVAIHRLAAP